MIDEIHVKNVALIRDATLVPSRGLTVLTGETGAGKTALLSACKLLTGERADATAVREGESELAVEGRFFSNDEEQVVSRRVGSDGRSRVSINGTMASVKELQEAIGPCVDLCGQHEHQLLLKASAHLALLDAWAADAVLPALEAYRAAYQQAEEAAAQLQHIQDASLASSAQLDEARFVLARIDAASPKEGEYEELVALLAKSEHAESLSAAFDGVHEALSGEEGAIDALQMAISMLDSVSAVDPKIGGLAANIREASFLLEDVSQEARNYRDSIEFDPQTLEANQERVATLQGLMRNFGPRMEDVLAKREQAFDLVSLVDDSEIRVRAAQNALTQAEEGLSAAADALDAARLATAPLFAAEVNEQLARLEMGGATLVCSVERMARSEWTKASPSQVEFLFQPAEGMQARPLARIASGGEISRVMLAIKVALGKSDAVETLIFDEVDAGVGGTTGLALANLLADLAQTHQVIVVTHLAQIAVRGTTHYQVVKQDAAGDGIPETELFALDAQARVKEIARMLSGNTTEASLKHAEEMLAAAGS